MIVSKKQPMPRWLRLLACSCGLLMASLSYAGGGPKVGQPAPSLQLRTLDGRELSTREMHGKVVILAFWASWCGACRQELEVLSTYAAAHADDGLQVIGISLDDPEQLPEVKRIAAGLSFPVAILGGAWAGDYGRIWRLPANFTIDPSGVLADNSWSDDRPEWTSDRLQLIVEPLLRERRVPASLAVR